MVLTRLGKRFFVGHAERLIADQKLHTEPKPGQKIVHVSSANAADCLQAITDIRPGVVLLAGCRLLSRQTLAQMPCPVLNYHAGIAPKYRGMNGGYWALASGDAENFGTTVHLVDAGVDTGGVLKQARGKPDPGDTISSYALRQAAFSRDICVEAVRDALAGKLATTKPNLPSKQWYHPTIWFYLWTGLTRRVW
jgi:folate-dependent phosphoribosylglycinamide formyltransferase PurN